MSEKYVVVHEFPDTGYMEYKGVCDNKEQAYGMAYFARVNGLEADEYYITLSEDRMGENGKIFDIRLKENGTVYAYVTVLYAEDNE